MAVVSEDALSVPAGLLERAAASAAGIASVDRLGAKVKRHRARGERTVLEYRFDGGLRLFAKHYPNPKDARDAYEILCVLWSQGFGQGSPHCVAEPLACFADWGVVVTRAATGHRLTKLAGRPEAWEDGLRAAAGWLARLHAVPLELGPCEDMAQGVFRLTRRAARAAAHHPELERLLVCLIEELAVRARRVGESRPQAQTHGRYHAGHVFVAPESVTVIDLDRAGLADPAKDVGEFLHRLRAQTMEAGLGEDAAERASLAFLEEYAAQADSVVPGGLVYHWSYSILATLLRLLEVDREGWQRRLEFYRAEFEDVPRCAVTLSGLA
jgi:hypothetical protein